MGKYIVPYWHYNDEQKDYAINDGSFCILSHFTLLHFKTNISLPSLIVLIFFKGNQSPLSHLFPVAANLKAFIILLDRASKQVIVLRLNIIISAH